MFYPNKRFWDENHTGEGEHDVMIVGAIRGHRAFRVDDAGWLTGFYFKTRWTEGTQTARCLQSKLRPEVTMMDPPFGGGPSGLVVDANGDLQFGDQYEGVKCPGVARGDHGCGFFVRFGSNRYQGSSDPLVRGVVDCWGQIEMGQLGFRAQYAKIIALVRPQLTYADFFKVLEAKRGIRELQQEIDERNDAAASASTLVMMEEILAKLPLLESRLATKRGIIDRYSRCVRLRDEIMLKYPNVPWFETEKEMLEEFPCPDPRYLLEDR